MYSEARDYRPLIGIDSQAYSARADVVFFRMRGWLGQPYSLFVTVHNLIWRQ